MRDTGCEFCTAFGVGCKCVSDACRTCKNLLRCGSLVFLLESAVLVFSLWKPLTQMYNCQMRDEYRPTLCCVQSWPLRLKSSLKGEGAEMLVVSGVCLYFDLHM